MRSRVVVIARAGRSGATELTTLEAHGAFALRRTGPHEVHVVGTAAGPLGGDAIDVRVEVGRGARLDLRGVAATIALPGRVAAPALVRLEVAVGPDAEASVALPPVVVTAQADVLATTLAQVDGTLDLVERVQLGRHGEGGGSWTGRLVADVGGHPALRQSQRSAGMLTAGWSGLVTRTLLGPQVQARDAACVGEAYLVPLARGGVLWTSFGADLPAAEAALAVLTPPLPSRC